MQICVNGSFHPSSQPVIRVSSRAFRYGDGIFETILFRDGEMPLFDYHMRRLYASIVLLGYQFNVTESDLSQLIRVLCEKNNCLAKARVRISVSAGNGFITDERESAHYVIEAREINPNSEQALISRLGLYPDAFKSRDILSNLKSSSALLYAQAAAYGRSNGMDDVVVLNSAGRVADSTIANVFCVYDGGILTPALTEGCVDGVMRRWLIDQVGAELNIREGELDPSILDSAEEIFLTNALRGILRVQQYKGMALKDDVSINLQQRLVLGGVVQ